MLRLGLILLLAPLLRADSVDLASPEMIADGSDLFAKNCAVGYCHGSEGRPGRGPALRDRVWDVRDLHRITAEGLEGTSMPGWKGIMADSAVWAVTAYVLSLSSEPPSGAAAIVEIGTAAAAAERAALSEEAARGRALFFDLTRQRRCGVCHALDGLGTAIGPNLTLAASTKSPHDLTRDIVTPQAQIAYGFEQVQVTLRSGETIAGVLAEETESVVRVYDTTSAPPPLRSVAKRDIRRQRKRNRSSMPDDLHEVYTADEIAAVVAYLSEIGR